jgi:uncharacterized membrane protein YqhA
MLRGMLAASRYFVMLSVAGSLLAAIALTLYGLFAVIVGIMDRVSDLLSGDLHLSHYEVEELAVEFLSIIDIFLLSTVFYIVALGLYELFVDRHLPLPHWLQIESLDQLKIRILGVVIVLIGVNFLSNYVPNPGDINILWLGISASLVIVALVIATRFMPHQDHPVSHEDAASVAALVAHMQAEQPRATPETPSPRQEAP